MNIVESRMIYKYGSFDSLDNLRMEGDIENEIKEDYGYFVDIENAEPVEIIEFYLVKSIYRNEYNVCRKNVKNPKYKGSKNNMDIEVEDTENDDYLMENIKNKCSYLFRCFIKNAYITFIGVTISMMLLCNMKDENVEMSE